MDFWSVIDRARGSDEPLAPSAPPEALRDVLERLDSDAVAEFMREFYRQLVRLNEWRLWGAGYVVAGGMSGDAFHYFRSWLIGKGRAAVELGLSDPDALGPFVDDEDVDNEPLEYVAVELLEDRGLGDPRDDVEGDADDEPRGEPFEEETVYAEFPRLAARFG